jgi:membrane protein HdeD
MASNNVILGILAIILGILVIAFPLLSIFTGSVLLGIAIIFAGIWLLAQGFKVWGESKWATIGYIILGIIAIIAGFDVFGSILAVSFLASFWLYFVGFFLIISGIMSFFIKDDTTSKGVGGIGIVLGILFLIIAAYAYNPFYLAYILGIWLIIDGITLFFVKPEEIAAE